MQTVACSGGGASGSMMLEDLMDKVGFRGKPKIVDLTSQRKLADKVRYSYRVHVRKALSD